eukprot:GCRY01001692.1.p1 GENE.GCRY01001692.1~~GCRY01001692.1.p1  ORF type:complete len:514 (-),score=66.41 GCRY01001692.1:1-1542(-)
MKPSVLEPAFPRFQLPEDSFSFSFDENLLRNEEKQLFDFLRALCLHFQLKTTLRVAGGWVRDLILGRQSHDIDIALDDMYGKDFALLVTEFQKQRGLEIAKYGVIKTNPDQSKHLETATVRIGNIWLDLVNLRSETYGSQTRIPEIKLGTPEEDARRRDLTFNALFYNLNTRCIEDFTRKGFSDLKNGIARTPLSPLETFLDDPLRVMRVIRFATRFGYTFARDLDHILRTPHENSGILEAFKAKISRERIGIELDEMLRGPRPVSSFTFLLQFNLLENVLLHERPCHLPDDISSINSDCILSLRSAYWVLAHILSPLEAENERSLLLCALLLPFRQLTYKVKNNYLPLTRFIVNSSVKFRHADAVCVEKHHEGFQQFVSFASSDDLPLSRYGMAIRKLGEHWLLSLLLAFVSEVAASKVLESVETELALWTFTHPLLESLKEKYQTLQNFISQHSLQDSFSLKPLVSGKQLQDLLKLPKGPVIGQTLERMLEWQIDHPGGTLEQCLFFLSQT